MTARELIDLILKETRGDLGVPVMCQQLDKNNLIYENHITFVERMEYSDGSLKAIGIR